MAALVWDATGTREFEMGTKKGVLYPYNLEEKSYDNGVAWNGLTAVTESPSGAEATDLYADDIKYASMRSAEDYGITIEAYTYPDEWGQCDGSAEVATGVQIGQQDRVMFGFSWVTTIGDDTTSNKGYKLHIAYGLTASPSERTYTTINDSPDAITFSWECESNPVNVTGHKPTGCITIDSTKANATDLATLEKKLYGSESEEPTLPMPDQVITIMKTTGGGG